MKICLRKLPIGLKIHRIGGGVGVRGVRDHFQSFGGCSFDDSKMRTYQPSKYDTDVDICKKKAHDCLPRIYLNDSKVFFYYYNVTILQIIVLSILLAPNSTRSI